MKQKMQWSLWTALKCGCTAYPRSWDPLASLFSTYVTLRPPHHTFFHPETSEKNIKYAASKKQKNCLSHPSASSLYLICAVASVFLSQSSKSRTGPITGLNGPILLRGGFYKHRERMNLGKAFRNRKKWIRKAYESHPGACAGWYCSITAVRVLSLTMYK